MRTNKIEKHIAHKMDEYGSPLNTDELWAFIEPDLEKDKKRRWVLWFIFGMSVLSIGLFSHFYFYFYENVEPETTAPADKPQSVFEPIANSNRGTNNSLSIKNKTKNRLIKENRNDTIINNTQSSSKKNELSFEKTNNQPNELTNPNNNIEINDERIFAQNKTTINYEKLALLKLGELAFQAGGKLNTKNILHHKITPVKNWKIFVALETGIYVTQRNLKTKPANGLNYLIARNRSEKVLETITAGINISLKNKNNYFLKGGFHINQLTEKFEHQATTISYNDIDFISQINYYSNGEIKNTLSNFEQRQETTDIKKTYNTLQWAEINLIGGYYFQKKQLNIGLYGGVVFSGPIKAEGQTLNAELNIIKIEEHAAEIYNRSFGMGGMLGIDVKYPLNKKIQLISNLNYKAYPSSVTTDEFPLEVKYNWIGGSVGLSYRLQ